MTKLELETKVAELESKLAESKKENLELVAHVQELSKTVKAEVVEKAVDVSQDDCVVLGGTKYGIIHRNTVKGISLEDYPKHFVDENLTAVVINKYGG